MKTGDLNSLITISTRTESTASGDVTETWGTPVSVRASVKQVDGTRYLSAEELVDRAVFKIVLWNNSYTNNIRIVFNSQTLYPIRPLTINPGSANLDEVTILCATKK